MKKRILSIVLLTVCLVFAGCGSKTGDVKNTENSKDQTIDSSIAVSTDSSDVNKETTEKSKENESASTSVSEAEPEQELESIVSGGFVIAPDRLTVVGGKFEQDGNPDNGRENIEWIVLCDNGDSLLLISKYVLDMMPFHSSYQGTDWDNSYIRKYLNNDFLNSAFSEENMAVITDYATTKGSEPKNSEAENTAGANAENGETSLSDSEVSSTTDNEEPSVTDPVVQPVYDKVFLLSYEEAMTFFGKTEGNCEARMAPVTEVAKSNGVWTIDEEGYTLFSFEKEGVSKAVIGCGNWWLRDSGGKNTQAMDVGPAGNIRTTGHDVGSKLDGYRPCIMIKVIE